MHYFFKKRTIFTAICAVALFAAMNLNPAFGAASDLFVIKVPLKTGFNEFVVADLRGYYEAEGLKAEYVGLVQGLSVYQMMAQGLLDVGDGHPNQVAQARLAGIKVKAVAPGMVDNPKYPHVRYIAREDGPIKSLDDIVGKKVGITNYGSCIDGYLIAYLEKKGIKGEIEWVTLPTGGQAEQALTQGLIDLTTSHPPFGSIAIMAGGNKQIASTWDIFHSPGAGLSIRAFSDDFIKAHPNEVRGFARAMYKARKWINENMEEAVPLVSKQLGLDPATVSAEKDGFWFEDAPDIKRDYIQQWFDLSENLGYWKHGDIEPEDIYTNEFAPPEEKS
jgi:ABC-type nitrate/sulfonate/bicarbonate transport system substrate-binding protein